MKVLITGDHESLPQGLKVRGEAVEWIQVQVLRFEGADISPEAKSRVFSEPPDWIIFPSPRSVEYWKTALGGLPKGTRLAAMGRATAEKLGAAASFVPTQSGSEGFFEEFMALHGVRGKRVLIAGAEGGRPWLPQKLEEGGAKVERLTLYRTFPLQSLGKIPAGVAAVVLTSPSSLEALLASGALPQGASLVSMGKFTSESLQRRGLKDFREIPGGDLARVGEVL